MLSLMEKRKVIKSELNNHLQTLKLELKKIDSYIDEVALEFKKAAALGDHSENAAYTEAKDDLEKASIRKLYLIQDIESIESLSSDINYVGKDYIGIYSTFTLRRLDDGSETTWMVFPSNISALNISVMASDSPIFKLVKGKQKGDKITVSHRVTNE